MLFRLVFDCHTLWQTRLESYKNILRWFQNGHSVAGVALHNNVNFVKSSDSAFFFLFKRDGAFLGCLSFRSRRHIHVLRVFNHIREIVAFNIARCYRHCHIKRHGAVNVGVNFQIKVFNLVGEVLDVVGKAIDPVAVHNVRPAPKSNGI